MNSADDYRKSIINAINDLSQTMGPETIFRDWCECMSLSIANSTDVAHSKKWEERESAYLRIADKYGDKAQVFPHMFADLTNLLEIDTFNDHLGRIYMELFRGNKNLGQCFTPISVCQMMADTICHLPDDYPNPKRLPYTVGDESCGGGATLLAAAESFYKQDKEFQKHIQFHAQDLDRLCVHMCYVQLSLIGVRAIVRHANTITQQVFDEFVSPMEVMARACMWDKFPVIRDEKTPEISETVIESGRNPVQLSLF